MRPWHDLLLPAVRLYADGFRSMTWGRTLWILILIKLVIMFAVLRVFFFRPHLSGMSDVERQDAVGRELVSPSRIGNRSPDSAE